MRFIRRVGLFLRHPVVALEYNEQTTDSNALSSRRGRIIVIFWIGAIRLRDRQFAMATFCPFHFPASIDPRTERQWQYCL